MIIPFRTTALLLLLITRIARAVLHEIDEMLLVDGKRMWDPHAGEWYPK